MKSMKKILPLLLGTLTSSSVTLLARGHPPPLRGSSLTNVLNHNQSCDDLDLLDSAWHYTWTKRTPCTAHEKSFIPMQWGKEWMDTLHEKVMGKGYDALLGFNEPDRDEQANMTVAEAIELWPQLEALGIPLGSPACSQKGTFTWLKEFMAEAEKRKLRVDFLALHVYWNCKKPSSMERFLKNVTDHYPGKDFWITEFGCLDEDYEGSAKYLKAVLPVLEAEPHLKRFAWWASRTTKRRGTSLIYPTAEGGLTPVGKVYVGVPNGLNHTKAAKKAARKAARKAEKQRLRRAARAAQNAVAA